MLFEPANHVEGLANTAGPKAFLPSIAVKGKARIVSRIIRSTRTGSNQAWCSTRQQSTTR
jgi:hypothetical protein